MPLPYRMKKEGLKMFLQYFLRLKMEFKMLLLYSLRLKIESKCFCGTF